MNKNEKRNKKKKVLWLKVSRDKYELPIAVADTSAELEKMLGLRRKSVIKQIYSAKKNNRNCQYIVIEIDEQMDRREDDNGMKNRKKEIKVHYPTIRKMYENGSKVKEIAAALDVSKEAIYNAITIMGISLRKKKLIEVENGLVYADNRPPILERLIIDGKRYVDITPLFSPR